MPSPTGAQAGHAGHGGRRDRRAAVTAMAAAACRSQVEVAVGPVSRLAVTASLRTREAPRPGRR